MGKLMKTSEIAERFLIKKGTVLNKLVEGTFPVKPLRINSRVLRWDEDDVNRYLEGLKEK